MSVVKTKKRSRAKPKAAKLQPQPSSALGEPVAPESGPQSITLPMPPFPSPPTDLLEEDGIPLESEWHVLEIHLLIELVHQHLAGREDYFVGGNMFIYFNAQQVRSLDYRGPDFFFVRDVPLSPFRKYWAVWNEGGRYPDVIIELSSPSTMEIDHTVKKDIYEKTFHTFEYFTFDPGEQILKGWRLHNHRYREIQPDERGFLWSEDLELWLGSWQGKYQKKEGVFLRFFDKEGNLVPTDKEHADAVEQRADAEEQRADAEEQRADAERQRAEAAEAELARLRTEQGKNGNGRKKKN